MKNEKPPLGSLGDIDCGPAITWRRVREADSGDAAKTDIGISGLKWDVGV